MRTRSIRFRLTVWYAAALTLGLGLFSGLIWLSLRQRLISELDRDLAGRSARFEQYLRGEAREVQGDQLRDELDEFCQALPPASYVDLRGSGGFQFHYPASAAFRGRGIVELKSAGPSQIDVAGRRQRLAKFVELVAKLIALDFPGLAAQVLLESGGPAGEIAVQLGDQTLPQRQPD